METCIECRKCKSKIIIENDDLIKIGRQQAINEVEKIIERLRE